MLWAWIFVILFSDVSLVPRIMPDTCYIIMIRVTFVELAKESSKNTGGEIG